MRYALACLFLLSSFIELSANNIQVVKNGPLHEAFVTKESGDYILQVVPERPPPPLTEAKPKTIDEQAIWIPGYWHWLREEGEYIWVSGVWRRPPYNHRWIPGQWKQYPTIWDSNGWVWMSGFWSESSASQITYIPQPPPDPIDEKRLASPQPGDNYFWVPGYWEWVSNAGQYRWLQGRWEVLEVNLQYVPAQYYWRESGYFLVPGFWDWPIEERGTAYADIAIAPNDREVVVHEPSKILFPLEILEKLFPYWPDYPSFFRFHFSFYYNLWISWGATPPWWQWYSWWSLPEKEAWWLWWWWTHPGYPNPPWLKAVLAEKMVAPPAFVLNMMKQILTPYIVTHNGVVGRKELIEAIEKASGKPYPILPSDPKQVEQIQELALPNTPKPPYLRPTGKGKLNQVPPKPNIGHASPHFKLPPGRVKALKALSEGSTDGIYSPPTLQTLHLDEFMNKSQPLRNPQGPRAYPTTP